MEEFINDKYSFVTLDILDFERKQKSYHSTDINVYMFDVEKKSKEIEKIKSASEKKKAEWEIKLYNRISFGSIGLEPNYQFVRDKKTFKADPRMHQLKVFKNDNPNFLKNCFQKMSRHLSSGKILNASGGWCTPEVKDLKSKTLYVPENITHKYNKAKKISEKLTLEEQNELFENYKYKYELIDAEEIGHRIVNG